MSRVRARARARLFFNVSSLYDGCGVCGLVCGQIINSGRRNRTFSSRAFLGRTPWHCCSPQFPCNLPIRIFYYCWFFFFFFVILKSCHRRLRARTCVCVCYTNTPSIKRVHVRALNVKCYHNAAALEWERNNGRGGSLDDIVGMNDTPPLPPQCCFSGRPHWRCFTKRFSCVWWVCACLTSSSSTTSAVIEPVNKIKKMLLHRRRKLT